jgi:hypothetical protein
VILRAGDSPQLEDLTLNLLKCFRRLKAQVNKDIEHIKKIVSLNLQKGPMR